jgi:hypothetical protein
MFDISCTWRKLEIGGYVLACQPYPGRRKAREKEK